MTIDKDAIIYTRDAEIGWVFKLKGNKIVLESHNWPESKSWLFKRLIKKFDKIITITYKLKELFFCAGLPDNRIMVASDGVDLDKFDLKISKDDARRKINLPNDKKIILYTGHLYEWKGVQTLAEASEYSSDNELTVFVGGTSEDEKKFRDKNKNLKNILIIGRKPHAEIPFYLKAADILILPNSAKKTISKLYTSPLKLFEYMAANRPIIASDLPSSREVLSEKYCLFFKPDDPVNLAEKIKILLNDKELAIRIAEQAYRKAKNCTWGKRAGEIINFIN